MEMDANSIPEFSDKRERKVDGGTRLHLLICQILPTNASVKTFLDALASLGSMLESDSLID